MGSPRRPSDAQLGGVLEDVAAHLEDPRPLPLAAAVRVRLETEPRRGSLPAQRAGRRARPVRVAFAGVALAVALSMLLAFSPATRRAIAEWLGLRGVRIEQHRGPPATALGGRLDLGEPVSLADATRETDFELLLPRTSRFGSPDEVYLADTPSGGRVTLLYRPRRELPPAAASGVGLLLTEFRAQIRDELVRKSVGADARLEQVVVDGGAGFWFEGGPHTVSFADEHGRFFDEETRLAGNTLIWEHDPLTLRLESGLSKGEAIRVAESLVRTRN